MASGLAIARGGHREGAAEEAEAAAEEAEAAAVAGSAAEAVVAGSAAGSATRARPQRSSRCRRSCTRARETR